MRDSANERLLVFIGDPACPVSILSIRNLTITVCYLKPIHCKLKLMISQLFSALKIIVPRIKRSLSIFKMTFCKNHAQAKI